MKVWHAGWFRSKSDRNMLDRTGTWRGAQGGHHVGERRRIRARKAPFDGVGTRMDVSADADALDCAYKLVEYGGEGCMKLSAGKAGRTAPTKQDIRDNLQSPMLNPRAPVRDPRRDIGAAIPGGECASG